MEEIMTVTRIIQLTSAMGLFTGISMNGLTFGIKRIQVQDKEERIIHNESIIFISSNPLVSHTLAKIT
jgi:hypothetical protein